MHTGFSGGRSDGLVFPSLEESQFIVIHTVKGFGIVNEAEVGVFLEFSCFVYDPVDVGNLISTSSVFSKSSLSIKSSWFTEDLKDFEHYLASMWNERNCTVVWTFFGTGLLWDWNENWPSRPVTITEFSKFAGYVECSTLTATSFMIWNSLVGIPSPLLPLPTKVHLVKAMVFLVM